MMILLLDFDTVSRFRIAGGDKASTGQSFSV
jgi:hypothetical protein